MLLKTRELDYNVCFGISHFTQFHLFILALKADLHKVACPSQKQRCLGGRGKSRVQKSSTDTWCMAQQLYLRLMSFRQVLQSPKAQMLTASPLNFH